MEKTSKILIKVINNRNFLNQEKAMVILLKFCIGLQFNKFKKYLLETKMILKNIYLNYIITKK
jgi:hypothetical protein